MKLRQLFENVYEQTGEDFDGSLKTIGVSFGRFNPPHKGHKAVWKAAASNPIWYVGTNESTSGPKDPLPYDVKLQCMAAVWPGIQGHVIPEQSLLTLAARIYEEHGSNVHLKVYTDEDWLVKTLTQYNGVEKEHGMYKFQQIDQVKTQRLASATNLRAAVRAGDRKAFYHDMGVKPSVTVEVDGREYPLFDVVAHYLNQYPEKTKKAVAEGEVVQFPKKHKGDLDGFDDCPKCGGDLQGGKYQGHQVKVCMPCKQVYLPPNSGIDQHGNKVVDEIAGAFPSPSTRAKWAADAAASNAAEAKRQEMLKAQQLQKNNELVDKEQKINHHSLDGVAVPPPTNEGPDERKRNATWAQITAHEKAAKATKNDIKRQHHLKMATDLRRSLPTSDEVNEIAMRMQGSSAEEKAANAAAKQREIEEKAKHAAIVKAYVDIMSKGQMLPPKMLQSYNTMPEFRKEVDAALANIPGRPGEVDLEQRKNYHLIPKNESNSDVMANTAKRLTDPNDGKTTKLRAAGDKRREEHLKSRDIAKKNECAGVGIITKQNSTADVNAGTPQKNLDAFNLEESNMSELHIEIQEHLEKKLAMFKAGRLDADVLGEYCVKLGHLLAKKHNIGTHWIQDAINDYVDDELGSENQLYEARGGMKKINKSQKAAMKNASTLPALNMNSGSMYLNYRMGVALAGAPNFPTKMEADNWIGGDPLLSTYTDEEFEMIKAAAKQVGAGTIQNWSGKRSLEVADVNKTSPVAKPKKNQYGV